MGEKHCLLLCTSHMLHLLCKARTAGCSPLTCCQACCPGTLRQARRLQCCLLICAGPRLSPPLLCMSSHPAEASTGVRLGRCKRCSPSATTLFRDSCVAVQSKFHDRVRIGAPKGEVHELWALFQTVDTLNDTGSTHARDFVHGALHPDPRARMSPAEMCLHPFMEEARVALLALRHQQGGKSPAEWRIHMEQLRVRTPAAKGRGPEARAVNMQQHACCPTCRSLMCSCCRQCTCRRAMPVAALCRVLVKWWCSGIAPCRELLLSCVCRLMPDISEGAAGCP